MHDVHVYERKDFKKAWELAFYIITVSHVLKTYKSVNPEGISLKIANEVDFHILRRNRSHIYRRGAIGKAGHSP